MQHSITRSSVGHVTRRNEEFALQCELKDLMAGSPFNLGNESSGRLELAAKADSVWVILRLNSPVNVVALADVKVP